MRELTIEEKAKRYDEVIKVIKDSRTHPNYPGFIRVDELFPELKESKEEKIKREIIKIVQYYGTSLNFKHTVSEEDMVAWLEKQGEQPKGKSALEAAKEEKVDNQNCVKPTDKVKPKFKAKDWYVSEVDGKIHNMYYSDDNDEPEHLLPQKCMYYTCIKDYYSSDNTHLYVKGHIYKYFFDRYINNESHFDLSFANSFAKKYFEHTKDEDWIVCEHDNVINKSMQYKEFKKEVTQKIIKNLEDKGLTLKLRLWTIEDAENGDVLVASDNSIFIFSHCIDNACVHHIALEVEDGTMDINYKLERGWETIRGVCPATKEQHDILFKAMTDAGYEFDFDKKELKKIK